MARHTGLEAAGPELQDIPPLLSARRHYVEHPLDEPAAPICWPSHRQLVVSLAPYGRTLCLITELMCAGGKQYIKRLEAEGV